MSGIAALFHADGRPADAGALERMARGIARRGPDGISTWTDGPAGMAHLSFAATPESARDGEALARGRGGCRVAWDGRIDNREEILGFLRERSDPEAAFAPDSELLLRAYGKWGMGCLERIAGEFAFALWDPRERRFFCGRDRMGLKPLHYFWDGRLLAVASEIKPLLGMLPRSPKPDDEMIIAFLLREFREEDEHKTFFDGIRRLPPAHNLAVEDGRLSLRRYWGIDPRRATRLAGNAEYEERFLHVFEDAVRCRLRSASPVAAFLSGGLDSSSIVCAAARLSSRPLEAFTVFQDHPDSDERRYARQVLEAAKIQGHEFYGAGGSPLDGLDEAIEIAESPVIGPNRRGAGPLIGEVLSRGCRVVLSGVGGDQILDEYGHLADVLASARPWRFRSALSNLAAGCGASRSEFLLMAFQDLAPQAVRYWGKRLTGRAPPSWINAETARKTQLLERIRRPRHSLRFPSRSQSGTYLEAFNPFRVLSFETDERTASWHGIDVRYPYLDSRLAEFVLSIPWDRRTVGGERKHLLRSAMRGILPETIRLRQGKGDYTPQAQESVRALCSRARPEPLADRSGLMRRYVDARGAEGMLKRFLDGNDACLNDIWYLVTLDRWLSRFIKGDPHAEERRLQTKILPSQAESVR